MIVFDTVENLIFLFGIVLGSTTMYYSCRSMPLSYWNKKRKGVKKC